MGERSAPTFWPLTEYPARHSGHGDLEGREVAHADTRFEGPRVLDLETGRGERIRTSGLYVPNVALYQAKLHPDSGRK